MIVHKSLKIVQHYVNKMLRSSCFIGKGLNNSLTKNECIGNMHRS